MKGKTICMVLSLVTISLFSGCEKKGPVEKAGEQIDKTVNEIQQKTHDAADDVKKSFSD
jgi:hypothetical protein